MEMIDKKENSNTALATIAGIITTLIGLLVLIGWQFDIAILKKIAFGAVTMKSNTAVCFFLAGLALIILQSSKRFTNTLVRFLALVIMLVGIISLFQNIFGLDFGLDEILFSEPDVAPGILHSNFMAPNTALNFLMIGIAFFLLTFKRFQRSFLVVIGIVFPLSISILWLIGYLTKFVEITVFFTYVEMSIYAAGTFIILCLGMVLTAYKQKQSSVTVEQKLLIGLTLIASVVIFITQLSFSGIHSLLNASELVEHTQQVKQQLTSILLKVVDVETSARGFVIIGEDSYAERMKKSSVELPIELKNLRMQISDNPNQLEALTLLEYLVNKRIGLSWRLYQTRRSQGLEKAILFFSNNEGKIITDSIRVIVAQMMAEESRLMQTRNSNEKDHSSKTKIIIYFSQAIQMLLLVLIFVFVKRDVANRKKTEEEIRNLNAHLEKKIEERTAQLVQINENLNKEIEERHRAQLETQKAKEEAERANVAKSEFLSRMSHELRTPMNSILGFAQLMEMGELVPAHKKGVKQILKNGMHLLDLINEVLDIARIESGRMTISTEPVEIYSIIKETLDIVRHLAEENQIVLESDSSMTKRLFAKADHQRLKQVLLNLITNAVKYNIKGGSVKIESRVQNIELKLEQPASFIRISIIDTGQGIAQEEIEKLFTPFVRIGTERVETEGTGLGLTISKKLIEAMGGKIGVESELGKGSTFWIELPQTESQRDCYDRINELTRPEPEIAQGKGTILYIEDNLSNLQLVDQILETHRPEIKLITNMYGRNAVPFAIDYKPDLIMLDLDLPDIHGSDVLKLLQAEPKTKAIPVVILSADAMTRQIKQLKEAGAKDYLIKPIDVVQFLKIVDERIRKSSLE
jgi:signal transduction histidine kinase